MSNINWSSIKKKAEDYLSRPVGKKRIKEAVDVIMLGRVTFGVNSSGSKSVKTPIQAANKFIEVLKKAVKDHAGSDYSSGELGSTAIDAVSLKYTTPRKMGNKYYVDLYFDGDLYRESLAPDTYDGIDNIVALLNKGYPKIHSVYGVWKGHGDEEIYSLTQRSGAHFIEQAVDDFMGNYGTDYGVIDIEVSDEYKS